MRSPDIHPNGHYIVKVGDQRVEARAVKRLAAKEGSARSVWWKVQLLEDANGIAAGTHMEISSMGFIAPAIMVGAHKASSVGPSNEAPAKLGITQPPTSEELTAAMAKPVEAYKPGLPPIRFGSRVKIALPKTTKVVIGIVGDELVVSIDQS